MNLWNAQNKLYDCSFLKIVPSVDLIESSIDNNADVTRALDDSTSKFKVV